jgi:metal-responsive CopG/Arc/MetJ family transcriptional regulator
MKAGDSTMLMRTHVILPVELVAEVDRLVGARRRSRFVEEAIRGQLRREKMATALRESAGSLKGDYPEWETPEKVSAWVAERRREDDEALERKLASGKRD